MSRQLWNAHRAHAAGAQVKDQSVLLKAALEAKTVTRFIPSEFGVDHSSAKADVPAILEPRQQIHRELMAAGLGYTLVHCNGFQEDWAAGVLQVMLKQLSSFHDSIQAISHVAACSARHC